MVELLLSGPKKPNVSFAAVVSVVVGLACVYPRCVTLSSPTQNGWTSLMYAAAGVNVPLLRLLLAQGASIYSENEVSALPERQRA